MSEPPPVTGSPQEAHDAEHLRLLTIFHYVNAGLTAAFASLFILHFIFALAIAARPEMFPMPPLQGQTSQAFPAALGYVFAVFVGVFIVLGWLFAAVTAYAGRCIKCRHRYWLILVVAALNCLLVPFGTILGVCTFIVLNRPTVKNLFASTVA